MAGRGRPRKEDAMDMADERRDVGIKPETLTDKKKADQAWQCAEESTYEVFHVLKDKKQIVKITKVTRQYHIDQGNKRTTRVKRRLFGQYRKIKGGWERYPGSPSVEQIKKLGINI